MSVDTTRGIVLGCATYRWYSSACHTCGSIDFDISKVNACSAKSAFVGGPDAEDPVKSLVFVVGSFGIRGSAEDCTSKDGSFMIPVYCLFCIIWCTCCCASSQGPKVEGLGVGSIVEAGVDFSTPSMDDIVVLSSEGAIIFTPFPVEDLSWPLSDSLSFAVRTLNGDRSYFPAAVEPNGIYLRLERILKENSFLKLEIANGR